MKKQLDHKEILLFNTRVHIYSDRIQIFNDDNVPFSEFKVTSDKIALYLIDEAFVEKKIAHIEVVSP